MKPVLFPWIGRKDAEIIIFLGLKNVTFSLKNSFEIKGEVFITDKQVNKTNDLRQVSRLMVLSAMEK